ncbi:autotransporter-associated beta strand repeat-containing protein, partial [Vineibacter terrae]|uniref:autotransporter-associated beta strand repeat-containing protein n=1 Tax=Vineibacter terrae TaxID=2586908 RepID=UPI002E309054
MCAVRRFVIGLLLWPLLVGLAAVPASAQQTWYWDVNGTALGIGGTGTWDTTSAFWNQDSNGVSGPMGLWNNAAGDNAIFNGTAGTVTLGGPMTAHNLTFGVAGYTLAGSTLTLTGTTPTISAAGTTAISSVIAGSAGITKTGGGVLTLTGANTFTGDITVSGGGLSLSGDAALGDAGNGISLANGTSVGSTGALAGSRVVTIVSGRAVATSGALTARFTGDGGLQVSGTISNNTNDYTGQTVFGQSTHGFTSVADLGVASSLGAPTDPTIGTISVSAGGGLGGSLVYSGDGDSSNRNWRFNNTSSGGNTFQNAGTGTLRLTGDILAGGGFGLTLNFSAASADMELLGVISSAVARNIAFTGNAGRTITLGDANTYTGPTTINTITVKAGTLANSGSNSSLGSGGTINFGNGTLSYTGSGGVTDRTLTISGAGTIKNDGTGALSFSGPTSFVAGGAADTLTLGGSFTGSNTFSGVISGAGNLTMSGAGTWMVSGSNTFTGTTTVQSGTLTAGSSTAIGASNPLVVNGGTLDLGGFDITAASLAGTGGTVALGNRTLTVNGASGATAFAGAITGNGGLTKLGASTLTLTGTSTYDGATTIGGGTLALDFSAAGAPASNIIDGASTLNMQGGRLLVTGTTGQTQSFAATNITAGSNSITGSGNVSINLGAISYNGGVVNFILPTTGTITTTPSTVLGGWATVTSGTTTDYAQVDGSGNIVARTVYDTKDDAGTWAAGDVVSDTGGNPNTAFFGTVNGNVQLGGLKYTVAAPSTVTIGGSNTLGVDGTIIVSSSVGSSTQTITGGNLTGSAGAGGTLGVLQNSTGTFTIASAIVDNGGATGVTVGGTGGTTGTGAVALTGVNSYTGGTTVSGATLAFNSVADGDAPSAIGASSNHSSNLVLENGTLRYTGSTASTDRGFTLVNGGLSRTFEVASAAANLTFSGLVTSPDDAGFTKTGAGTLTLTNANNDYVGVTTIAGGMLAVSTLTDGGQASGVGAASNVSSNLVLQGGGKLGYIGADASSDRGFMLGTGGGGIDVIGGTTLTMSGTATGAGGLTKSGAGTLVLSGTNDYTGGTAVSAGILRAGSVQAFGTGVMTVSTGATLDLAGNNNTMRGLNGEGSVLLGAATLTTNGNGSFSGTISGTGGITIAAGTETVSGCTNSYGGTTTINGTLSVGCLRNGGQPSDIGASGSGSANLQISSGTLIYTGGSVVTDRGFTLAGTGAINVTNADTTLEFSGVATGTSLNKTGPGTLVLSGANTYNGTTFVNGGTLRAGSTSAFGTSGLRMDTTGATLDLNNFDNTVASISQLNIGITGGSITLGSATLTISNGAGSYNGPISGSGGLVKSGPGTQTLSGGASSYSGSTTINGGILAVTTLANGGSNSSIGASSPDASNLIINGGTLRYGGTGGSTDRRFTLGTSGGGLDASGTGAINFTSGAPVTLSPGGNRTLTIGGTSTADNSLSARIDNPTGGTTALTKKDAGTWVLKNAESTYTGVTTISGGVLAVDKLANGGQPSSIGMSGPAASNLAIGSGSTLRYTGTGDTTDRLFTLQTGVSYIESSGTGPIVFSNTGSAAYTGNGNRTLALGGTSTGLNTMGGTIINGPGGVTQVAKNDSGTWVLTGNNTYTGNTVINDGNLIIGNGGTTGNAGAGNVIVAAVTSTLSFNRSDAFDFTGTLSGLGSIAQIGTGTTVLTAAGNTIGATRIDAGVLQVNGGLTTPTLALNGTSTLTVNGAVQALGPTTTTFTGDAGPSTINVNAGGILRANGDLGAGSDVVTVTGVLNTGTAALSLGAGDDTLVLNDSAVLIGIGVNAGTGIDTLQVNTVTARTLDGATVPGFEALNKQLAGTLTLTGDHSYIAGTTIGAGTLQIGAGGTSGSLVGDVLNNGTLAFDRSDTVTFAGAISGPGIVNQVGGGTTILTGTSTYGGATNVQAGTLRVNGNQSGAMGLTSVDSGATLGGTGIIGGDVVVANGGILSPGGVGSAAGTLTINGGLTLNSLSALNYDFGQANVVGGPLNDHTIVGGDLVLDGTINVAVTPGGSLGPGVYRIISYSGMLANNGLDVTAPGFTVQTSVANQVNLVNTSGLTLTYWDGNAGPKNNSAVNGGNGVWQNASGNDNWTDSSGAANAPWTNGSFAIFAGASGTVTVDNGLGQVSASGMQLATGGYVIEGGDIALVGPQSIIRVGDGTAAGAGFVATINADLTGSTQLVKTDLGTLVLAGTNTYTGGTAINGGTLQVSSDANLGDAAGALSFDGGTLRNTASFTTARGVTLLDGGGTFQTDADLTVAGVVGGTGALTKTGTGTLTLTDTNTYAGGTIINAGTVSVSSNANLGDAAGALTVSGGTLQNTAAFTTSRGMMLLAGGGTFETVADLAVSGAIGAAGALTKSGAATLTLTGSNTYAGGTTIAAGTLQLGDGGTAGSIVGDVANNGTLVFNRADTVTFDGVIAGSGVVNQVGGGTTILTGANSYAGLTNVQAGGLIVNGDQSAATGLTSVDSGAALGGIGTIGGDVTVADGGALNPGTLGNVPGTLTINGGLALGNGSALNYNFGQANVVGGPFNDHTKVGGDLVLDGTLNVTQSAGGNFNPGIYRVISYNGNLANNVLELGALPAGDFAVQTSVANQVNLVQMTGTLLSFWDGPAGGINDGNIRGGDGTWRLSDNEFWTNDTGSINAPYANATFAIFAGTRGTVAIENTNGEVRASGMQFATSGYRLTGGPLELTGGRSIIRVGDGTSDGAGYVATIDSVLTGSAALVKSDLGTLVLTGNNTYSGGTVIEGGVISISSDANLGDPNGGVTFDGGTLQNTANFNSARPVALSTGGGTFQADADRTQSGPISGVGALTKSGPAALILTGGNTYTGGTTITAGTLQLGDGGTAGSIVGDVTNNGTLAFNRSDDVVFGGVISGNGRVRHIGSGLTDITGDSAGFAGTTSVEAGTLAVNGRLCGDVNVLSGGRVQGTGFICTTNNAGVVAPGNSIGTLTVVGNYTGFGGTLEIETQLGGDASPTDRLVVTGNTAGSTNVRVVNVGGTGAQTVEGIKVIDVGGTSNGVFTLQSDYVFQGQPAIVAGAYSYTLQKNGVSAPTDGDWYLRSSLTSPAPGTPAGPLYQPGVPVYEAYPQVLLGMNGLPTLRERVGDRYWSDERPAAPPAAPASPTAPDGSAVPQVMWGRMEGQHSRVEPNRSTTGASWEADQLKLQAGLDGLFLETGAGRLFGGITVQYGYAAADVRSVYGSGGIHVDGYSVGGTLTWAGWNGLYVDGQAQASFYHSRLASGTLGRRLATNDGFGYAFGLEAGQRVALGGSAWSLTPQAQLVYSAVDFEAFTDPFGARVKAGDGDRLTGRFGLAADYRSSWRT